MLTLHMQPTSSLYSAKGKTKNLPACGTTVTKSRLMQTYSAAQWVQKIAFYPGIFYWRAAYVWISFMCRTGFSFMQGSCLILDRSYHHLALSKESNNLHRRTQNLTHFHPPPTLISLHHSGIIKECIITPPVSCHRLCSGFLHALFSTLIASILFASSCMAAPT